MADTNNDLYRVVPYLSTASHATVACSSDCGPIQISQAVNASAPRGHVLPARLAHLLRAEPLGGGQHDRPAAPK